MDKQKKINALVSLLEKIEATCRKDIFIVEREGYNKGELPMTPYFEDMLAISIAFKEWVASGEDEMHFLAYSNPRSEQIISYCEKKIREREYLDSLWHGKEDYQYIFAELQWLHSRLDITKNFLNNLAKEMTEK